MSITVHSAALSGLDARLIDVEADVSPGLPGFVIVGLPDKAVEEARERVRAAIRNSNLPFPRTKVTVNLAPANIKKEGPAYDLPIAIALLRCLPEEIPWKEKGEDKTQDAIFVGELALDGTLRPIRGALAIALEAKAHEIQTIYISEGNAREAACIDGVTVIPVASLRALLEHLLGKQQIATMPKTPMESPQLSTYAHHDFAYIQGQEFAKRALQVAAAGAHHVLFHGPPGSGKTILARALATILPPLTMDEAIEVMRIHSVAGALSPHEQLMVDRPFRSPHHTTSDVALVGGGAIPRPGEISLAHRGVLFMDELPEFDRNVLETLRQPLEDGTVTVARAQGTFQFPARFMLIAAQNPCPCGYRFDPEHPCVCTPQALFRYEKKISGPLLDRIDLRVEVPRIQYDILKREPSEVSSAALRAEVSRARHIQEERFHGRAITTNSEMTIRDIHAFCSLDHAATTLFHQLVGHMHLSGRGATRLLKVARTIADLAGMETIQTGHIAEAAQYRKKEER